MKFIFFLIYLFQISKSEISEIEITENNYIQHIQICLTQENQCFNTIVDINSLYTWIPGSENKINFQKVFYEKSSDINIINDNITVMYEDNKRKINGKILSSKCLIANNNFNNFNFINVYSTEYIYDKKLEGYFGLGYPFTNEGKVYSSLMNFEKNNYINKKVFSIYYKENKGKLLLGRIPNEINNDNKNFGFCNIENNFKNDFGIWFCQIKGLILGKTMKDTIIDFEDNNNKIRFDYNLNKTLFPINYILKIEQIYFHNLIEKGDCNFGVKKNYFTFTCSENNYNELTDLTLLLNNNIGLFISKNDLFIYDEIDKEYEFIFYSKDGVKDFSLGSDLLKKYYMVFNMDDNQIGFYNNQNKLINFNNEEEERKKEEEEKKKKEEEEKKKKEEEEKRKKEYEEERKKEEEEKKKKEEEEKSKKEEEEKKKDNPINPNNNDKKNDKNNDGGFSFGKFILIIFIFIILFIGFRYYKRKKSSSGYYYKAANELFNSGIQLEDQD